MINYKQKKIVILISLCILISAFVNKSYGQNNIKRILTFTTQNSLKLEASFNTIPSGAKFNIKIVDDKSQEIVFNKEVSVAEIKSIENKLLFYVNNLKVKEWTPVNPNLYQLIFTENLDGKTEQQNQRIGFRLFEAKNGNLYLNNHLIFLRGIAINPPGRGIPDSIETSRKFAEDYISFMKSIHVNIIRIPDDTTWYNVCDELGMMVFGGNYSGSVNGEKPPKDYDKAVSWYENKKYVPIASHPSLMIYAMTNETPFEGDIHLRWKKFLSYAHEQLKKWDSTRVYIGNAGYGYGQSGDICDLHRYWGWYYSSPFTFLHIRYDEDIIPFKKETIQPITFTECVGNYTGPGGEYNLTPNHKNPGSQLNWTGHAPWELQSQLADEHQCFTFQHAAEYFRQLRNVNHELSGLFPFTILFHNWNTIKSFVDMDPKAVTKQAKISYQPILISWECFTPQVYAGSTLHPAAHIINDDDNFNDLNNASLVYQLEDNTNTILTADTIALPQIKYYGTFEKNISIELPDLLPAGDYKLIGKIIKQNTIVSTNYYDLFIAGKNFIASVPAVQKQILLYDPQDETKQALEKLDIKTQTISSFTNLKSDKTILVIGENTADEGLKKNATTIKKFIKAGGRVICFGQDEMHLENLNAILNCHLINIKMNLDTAVYPPPPRPSRNGYNVNIERQDNPIFSGIKRNNLIYWSDYTGWNESKPGFPAIYPVTNGFVLENKNDIGSVAVLADYGPALDGIAVAEMFQGKGSVLLCGLDIAHRAGIDPVAGRIMKNIISYTGNRYDHKKYVLINSPITWGDYASERGILTGINSGLLLNSKPRLIGSYSKTSLAITKQGDELAGHGGGFNTQPGLQYVPYGRRPFGPYHLRGFGDIPYPDSSNNNIGEGTFWCSILPGKTKSSTLVWNPSDENLELTIKVNSQKTTKEINAGEKIIVDCPVNSTNIKMSFAGDRRLVLLQTSFE
jgi:beta-galactosidase